MAFQEQEITHSSGVILSVSQNEKLAANEYALKFEVPASIIVSVTFCLTEGEKGYIPDDLIPEGFARENIATIDLLIATLPQMTAQQIFDMFELHRMLAA